MELKDKVRVKSGFYEWVEGEVIFKQNTTKNAYNVRFTDGNQRWFYDFELEKI